MENVKYLKVIRVQNAVYYQDSLFKNICGDLKSVLYLHRSIEVNISKDMSIKVITSKHLTEFSSYKANDLNVLLLYAL